MQCKPAGLDRHHARHATLVSLSQPSVYTRMPERCESAPRTAEAAGLERHRA